jgi:hypothetical protein
MSLAIIVTTKALSVVAGVSAAYLWWKASGVPRPAPGAAIAGTSPIDSFNLALHQSALLNQWAATFTAISVFRMASAEVSGSPASFR